MQPLFTGQSRQKAQIDLSRQRASNTQDDIKRARQAREGERIRAQAATVISSHWRRKQVSSQVASLRGQEFDAVELKEETLVKATSLLLHSWNPTKASDSTMIGRFGTWCRFALVEKALFYPLTSGEVATVRWIALLSSMAVILLSVTASSPL